MASDEFSVDIFADSDPIVFTKRMEGYGVLADVG